MPDKAHIDVYARIRPCKRPSGNMDLDFADHAVGIHMVKDNTRDVVNNQRENYHFHFSRILDGGTTQDQVFDVVAQPVVESAAPVARGGGAGPLEPRPLRRVPV